MTSGRRQESFPAGASVYTAASDMSPLTTNTNVAKNTSGVLPVRKFTVTQARTPNRRNKEGRGGKGSTWMEKSA